MKLKHLWIDQYKNLRNCEINWASSSLLNVIIGSNGSGKSNVIEAILHILIGIYFRRSPPFSFRFEFEAQRRQIELKSERRRVAVSIDNERLPLRLFATRLRDGSSQVFYPESTFVYYSGDCRRVQRLIKRYQLHFQKLTRNPETDAYKPLFVQTTNQQAQVILLALVAHNHRKLLGHLRILDVRNVTLVLRSPTGFDPNRDEPILWNTVGAVRRILGAVNEIGISQESRRYEVPDSSSSSEQEGETYTETRTYRFSDGGSRTNSIIALAERLAAVGDNIYLALEHLRTRGIFSSVEYELVSADDRTTFDFDNLSEGEKQLIAVIGALTLTTQNDNLVLLDEPDTHLNPQWSWEYSDMLAEAFLPDQRSRSAVLMASHDPIIISGLTRDQVFLVPLTEGDSVITNPRRDPRGQGIANLLASSEFFGLPSSLDKHTQQLLDERLAISVKQRLTPEDKTRLKELNAKLEILTPGVSERDPNYVSFLRQQHKGRATS
jgi:energy-coupling factor transporter ATP-binding protein EcfA2